MLLNTITAISSAVALISFFVSLSYFRTLRYARRQERTLETILDAEGVPNKLQILYSLRANEDESRRLAELLFLIRIGINKDEIGLYNRIISQVNLTSFAGGYSDKVFVRLLWSLGILVISFSTSVASVLLPNSLGASDSPLEACKSSSDRPLEGLIEGNMAFNAPARMYLNDETTVDVVLGTEACPLDLLLQKLAELRSGTVGTDEKRQEATQPVILGPVMTATLSGDGFTVKPEGPWQQSVGPRRTTSWQWTIKANESGRRFLILVLAAKLSPNDLAPSATPVSRPIEVEVRPHQWDPSLARFKPPIEWEHVMIFAFGVVFVATILALAIFIPNPTDFQYTVIRIILAISAAAVATLLTGFLTVEISTSIKAGGALAVFVIVYFWSPAALVRSPRGRRQR